MQESPCPLGADCGRISRLEADYNRLFNRSLDLICIAGLDGYFKRVNPSWTRVLGWTEEELLSRPVEHFMHPEDRDRTLQARSGLSQGIPVRGLENRYRCKDGTYRWLSWQSVVEPGATLVFAIARDITERRQLENERLVLSKLESTGVLAGGIAHDFNNLLASLQLNLDMVSLSGTTSKPQEQHLAQARETIHAAKRITQQLIAFADGETSPRRIVDLRVLLRQSLELALSGSAVRPESQIAPDLWPAEVDEEQIGQMMHTVILNAREAMRGDGVLRLEAVNVTLEIPPGPECAPGGYVRIRVTDSGIGIPDDVLPRIFDPYFSTKQRGTQKGMGLGLTICRNVIQRHGGTVGVESAVGRGTTVTIHLPARHQPVAGAAPVAAAGAAPSRRILVMDDEQVIREIVGHTLGHLGYEVVLAKDGEEALAAYVRANGEGRPFAAVLLDLTVRGGMGGSETMRRLRALDAGVKAILMTGYSNDAAFRDPVAHGFKAALGKPFSAESLRLLLEEILREG